MLFDYSATRELYICFHDDSAYFGSRFIKKGFKHVFVIERQALGWICTDASRTDLSNTILPASWGTDIIPTFIENNPSITVVKLLVTLTGKANFPRPGMLSCVGIVQYILGVCWPTVLTPWMLYNRIIKKPPSHIKVLELCQAAEMENSRRQ